MVWGNFLWKNLLDFGGQTPAHMFWGPFFREKNCAKKSNVENKLQLFRSCRKNWWRPKYVQQGRKDIVKKKQAPPNNTPGNLNFNYSKVFYPF